MGNDYNSYTNNDLNNSDNKMVNSSKSAPEFYLNKNFPNHYNLSIEEVIQNFLKSKYDLLDNKKLTTSLSKEFKLLFSVNSKLSNNSLEKMNRQEIEENIKKLSSKILNQSLKVKELESKELNNKDTNNNNSTNPEEITLSIQKVIDNENENDKIILKSSNNITNYNENNEKLDKKIVLDSLNNEENNDNNTYKKKKNKFFLSDYNIYSCNENSNHIINNKENGDNCNSDMNNLILIQNETNDKQDKDNNNNNNINNDSNENEEKENGNLFDNLSNKTEYNTKKGRKKEIEINEENKKENINNIKNIKNEKNEEEKSNKKIKKKEDKDKTKKSSKSLSRNKSNHKIRKYTEIEPSLITTKAASLNKDIRKEYKFKACLGGGHFGTVRKAYKKSDKEILTYYAIKSIPMKNLSSNIDDFVKEVDIISTLDHPNIIKFYETYHDKCFFHIVMELCKGKEILYQMTNKGCMEEKKVVTIIYKVLLAIAHCHNRGITHRDLKPENILFDSMKDDAEIKLIDFGLSRKYDKEQKMHSILGTPYYVAPEVLKGEYDEKCDIWSIGAVTYLLLCGDPPFTGNSNNEIFKKIVNDNIRFNFNKWKNISNNAKDFVKICLNKNSIKRPSASEALKHPWFSNVLKEIHNFDNIKKEILINIKNFNINYIFKKMVLKYLINTLTDEEKKTYKAAFYAVDYNHNGFILPQELKQVYDSLKIDITDEQINYLFDILPKNKKLGMGYSEFIMAGVDQQKLFTKENLEDAFKYFDINKTGFIEYDNLNSALLRMGKKYVNSDDVISIIKDVIKNIKSDKEYENIEKDYKISKEDFMKMFIN